MWMRRMAMIASIGTLAGAALCLDAQQSAPRKPAPMMVTTGSPTAPKEKPLLPEAFAGWGAAEKAKPVTDLAQLDTANPAPLKEYSCTGGVVADYKRGSETLSVKALTFNDLSGAYGAYSFYRQNGWPKADIGTGGASDNSRVLFWKGNTVVDAAFSHVGP